VRPEQLAQATMNDSYVALTNLGFNKLHSMGGFQPGVSVSDRVTAQGYTVLRTQHGF
jgi:hypothetical protein